MGCRRLASMVACSATLPWLTDDRRAFMLRPTWQQAATPVGAASGLGVAPCVRHAVAVCIGAGALVHRMVTVWVTAALAGLSEQGWRTLVGLGGAGAVPMYWWLGGPLGYRFTRRRGS
jgi:hypothetical protein